MTSTSFPMNALFLAEDESMLRLDRKVLRNSNVTQSGFFASGRKALDTLLAGSVSGLAAAGGGQTVATAPLPVDLIVCNERLADMTGLQFLAYLRGMRECADIPVLFLVSNPESPTALAASASRSCAVLSRPYSPRDAEKAVALAGEPHMRQSPLALPPSFTGGYGDKVRTSSVSETPKPLLRREQRKAAPGEIALREGLKALQNDDLGTAEKFLNGALSADPMRVETYLALAKLMQMRLDEAQSYIWIARAAALCLRRNDKTKAREILSRLPGGKIGQAPLLQVAGESLNAGEAKAAALLFLEAQRLDPALGLHALISRTCMFTPAPEESIKELVKALASSGHEATAAKLHTRLLRDPRLEEEEDESSFLARFPLLHDIVTVATHTFKTWRFAA